MIYSYSIRTVYQLQYNKTQFFISSEKDVLMNVSADLYEEVMNPESMFKLTAAVRVVESNKLLATTEVFNLKKPALEFEVWLFLKKF